MRYVDGFLIALPKKNVAAYRTMSRKAGKIWKEYGALEYRECIGDDLKVPPGVASFLRTARTKKGETVVFSWIVYRSKAARDRVNKKILKDPRMLPIMEAPALFEAKRMTYGGFKIIVDL